MVLRTTRLRQLAVRDPDFSYGDLSVTMCQWHAKVCACVENKMLLLESQNYCALFLNQLKCVLMMKM